MTIKKRALVLSGGGSRGSYQVGVLKALSEQSHISWDSVHGVSVGSLNAAWLAMHTKTDQPACISGLINIWNSIESSLDIYEPWLPLKLNYVSSMWKGSLYTGKPLEKLINNFWDSSKLRESGIKLTVGCCSLSTLKYKDIVNSEVSDDSLKSYVLASTHVPIIFEPLFIDNELWIDGGLQHLIPLQAAIAENPDVIDVVLSSPVHDRHIDIGGKENLSAPQVAIRSTMLITNQVLRTDYEFLRRAIEIYKEIEFNIYMPLNNPTPESLNFDGEHIKKGIELGYRDTINRLNVK
jgi:NTE family protein